jgi:hypothetical protein
MAIQGSGDVELPENGGWYVRVEEPAMYIVAPGFSDAWISHYAAGGG